MRTIEYLSAAALLSSSTIATASSDYYLQIKGAARESASGPIYLDVASNGDLDGDGIADEAIVRIVCAGGELRTAEYQVKAPRDAASGQASGKRMHKPVTFIKEWAAASPMLMAIKPSYDIKKVEGTGARKTMGEDSWTQMTLSNAEGLCPAAEASMTKSRSNIQNN